MNKTYIETIEQEITDEDFNHIGQLVADGYTSGQFKGENKTISWTLETKTF